MGRQFTDYTSLNWTKPKLKPVISVDVILACMLFEYTWILKTHASLKGTQKYAELSDWLFLANMPS